LVLSVLKLAVLGAMTARGRLCPVSRTKESAFPLNRSRVAELCILLGLLSCDFALPCQQERAGDPGPAQSGRAVSFVSRGL